MMRVLLLLISILGCAVTYGSAVPEARQGAVDFKHWHLNPAGLFPLDGEWLFCPGKLFTLEQLTDERLLESAHFPQGLLECSSLSDGLLPTQIPEFCVATYVLELRGLPEQPLSIFIPEIASSFRLFWNDTEIARGGFPAVNPEVFQPYAGHRIARIPDISDQGVLILQVANLDQTQPALQKSLILGDAGEIHNYFSSGELLQALTGALAAIAGILVFLQYLARYRYEPGLWSLSLFSFAVALYIYSEGYNVLNWFIDHPELQWALALRLNMIAVNLFAPCLLIWLAGCYKILFPDWLRLISRGQLLFVIPALMWFPVPWLIMLEPVMTWWNMSFGLVIGYYAIRSPWQESGEKLAMVTTVFICLASALHDGLMYQHLFIGDDWLHIGFTCFILGQIFILAVIRARKHARLQRLNQTLEISRAHHQKRADARNRDLKLKVAELEMVNEELQYLMRFDGLTGLLRQNILISECQLRVSKVVLSEQSVSMIVLDIDRYKQISAQYGYLAADQAMQDVAQLLEQWASHDDFWAARADGESFILFAMNMSEQEALQEAEWLRLRIQQQVVALSGLHNPEMNFHVSASFGLSSCQADEAVLERLLKESSLALNKAKMQGRNCVVSYHQMLNDVNAPLRHESSD